MEGVARHWKRAVQRGDEIAIPGGIKETHGCGSDKVQQQNYSVRWMVGVDDLKGLFQTE